jgi:hypothetical protein
VHHQQVGVAAGEHVRADAHRRHREKAVGRGLQRVGQLHAADVVVLRRAHHSGFDKRLVRIVRGLRQHDLLAVEVRLLRIDDAIGRRVLFACDALAGVEHRVEGFTRVV